MATTPFWWLFQPSHRTPREWPIYSNTPPCAEAVVIDLPLLKAAEQDGATPPASPSPALVKLCRQLLDGSLSAENKAILLETWEQELEGIHRKTEYHQEAVVRLTLQPFDDTAWERLLLETFSRTTALPDPESIRQGRFVVGALEVV